MNDIYLVHALRRHLVWREQANKAVNDLIRFYERTGRTRPRPKKKYPVSTPVIKFKMKRK